jgi:hypothetical protein
MILVDKGLQPSTLACCSTIQQGIGGTMWVLPWEEPGCFAVGTPSDFLDWKVPFP